MIGIVLNACIWNNLVRVASLNVIGLASIRWGAVTFKKD